MKKKIKLIIGQDEVGVGDYFGPLVVVSVFIEKKNKKKILEKENIKIGDSKKISDKKIIKTVTEILPFLDYSCAIINNEQYNQLINNNYNSHLIKTIAHLKALSYLKEKINPNFLIEKIIIDKFVNEKKFVDYLSKIKKDKIFNSEIWKNIEPLLQNNILILKEKAESIYPEVALASMLSRFFFLKKIRELEVITAKKIPLGAGKIVNYFVKQLIKEDKDFWNLKANKLLKLHFKNTKQITG